MYFVIQSLILVVICVLRHNDFNCDYFMTYFREYYFSIENLCKDLYLRNNVSFFITYVVKFKFLNIYFFLLIDGLGGLC